MKTMLGPLFLIPVFIFAGQHVLNYDLIAIGGLGLVLSSTKQTRGCVYALVLLALSAIFKHLWIDSHHLFQVCLECSVAFSLILTSLIFTEATDASALLQAQMERKGETIQFLEDDLAKQREKSAEETTHATERLAALQQQLEETQNELSAIHTLNEVLRKSTAKALDQDSKSASLLLCAESRAGLLLEEIDALQRECHRLSNEGDLAEQNKDLFKELNDARFKASQTHLINETLARMLAVGAEKTKDLERKIEELEQKELAPPILSKRLEQNAQTEALYRQLREQFAEKDQTLHQARVQLFQVETELAKIQKELSEQHLQQDPLHPSMRKEIELVEEERTLLAEENHHLTELITQLMATAPEKKK